MSKIKELRNDESNNINLIDLISNLVIEDKTKYIEMFRKLMTEKVNNNGRANKLLSSIKSRFAEEGEFTFSDLTVFDVMFLSTIIDTVEVDNINLFNKFCEFNERKLVENNDVTSYKNFDQIANEVNKVELKLITKDLEKQVITLLNDEDWVIIKPLSFEASKKYGSNTKWCTTMATDPSYFYKYFRNGILVYCINKKTGYKVAAFKKLSERETSFWNQQDNRIDSFESELSGEIISLLKKEFKECKKANFSFADPDALKREMDYNRVSYRDNLNEPVGLPLRGRVPINNAFDGEEDGEMEEMVPNDPIEQNEVVRGRFLTADREPELLDIPEDFAEEIEAPQEGAYVPLTNDEIIEMLSPNKGNQIVDFDDELPMEIGSEHYTGLKSAHRMIDLDDNVQEVAMGLDELHVDMEIRQVPFAVIKETPMRLVETDDMDYGEGRTEGIEAAPQPEGLGGWPEDEVRINVRR